MVQTTICKFGSATISRRVILCALLAYAPSVCAGQIRDSSPEANAATHFWKGLNLLESGKPRSEVLAEWQTGLLKDSSSGRAKQFAEDAAVLKRQVLDDLALAKETVAKPDQLPLDRRIDYLIKRFVDVHGSQMGQPGFCHTVSIGNLFVNRQPSVDSGGPGVFYSDSVVKIGKPAMPALIEHLTDTRLTRSYGYRMGYTHVLRVQDVAEECIECITHCRFFFERATVDYMSMGPPERTQKIRDDIAAWWERNKDKPIIDGYIDRLSMLEHDKAWIGYRLEMLEKIEEVNPNIVNSKAVLRSWLRAAPDDIETRTIVARELGKRGDISQLDAMRRLIRESKLDSVPSDCTQYLLLYGADSDYAAIGARVADAIKAAGENEQQLGFAWQVLNISAGQKIGSFDSVSDPRLVPMLVGLLKFRHSIGGIGSPPNDATITIADEAMQSLVFLTSHDTGYEYMQPEVKRFAAIDSWLAWWKDVGSKRTFNKRQL